MDALPLDKLPAHCLESFVSHLDYETLTACKEVSQTMNGVCTKLEEKVRRALLISETRARE